MSRYADGFNSSQYSFFPISLDDMIDEDNPVRGISAIVDSMDESVLKFTHSSTKSTGVHHTIQLACLKCICTAILMVFVHHAKSKENASVTSNCFGLPTV